MPRRRQGRTQRERDDFACQTDPAYQSTSESGELSLTLGRSGSEAVGPCLVLRSIPGDAEEDVDHARIELRSRRLAEPQTRLLGAETLAVGPIGRHRVERVADEDDPGLDRNLLAGLAVGIAGAVPT